MIVGIRRSWVKKTVKYAVLLGGLAGLLALSSIDRKIKFGDDASFGSNNAIAAALDQNVSKNSSKNESALVPPPTCQPCDHDLNGTLANGMKKKNNKPKYLLYHSLESLSVKSNQFLNVRYVLDSFGFEETRGPDDNFTLFWTWNQPFQHFNQIVLDMKPHQFLNKVPGLQSITNKLTLSMSGFKYVPKAFRLPSQIDELRSFAQSNPKAKFVFKNNGHRGVKIASLTSQELRAASNAFVQEFVTDPLLVEGYKFDIGVYVVITSIDPLRIYVFDEVQLRFCLLPYHPFNALKTESYVVSTDYKHIWSIPGMKGLFPNFSRKQILTKLIREKGLDADAMWRKLESVVVELVLLKHPLLVQVSKQYQQSQNFFELLRFDFLLNEQLHPTLLEVNMSPFLNAVSAGELRRLHRQVIFSTLRLTGFEQRQELEDVFRDHIFPESCVGLDCQDKCQESSCRFCPDCLSTDEVFQLRKSYRENLRSASARFHRIFPPNGTVKTQTSSGGKLNVHSAKTQKFMDWCKTMCREDPKWCW